MEQTGEAREKVRDKVALTMAKEIAIVAGQVLSLEEMKSLVDELFKTALPSRTPEGKSVVYIMADNEIERNFQR